MDRPQIDYVVTGPNGLTARFTAGGRTNKVSFADRQLQHIEGWDIATVVKHCRQKGWTITPEPTDLTVYKDNTAGFF